MKVMSKIIFSVTSSNGCQTPSA